MSKRDPYLEFIESKSRVPQMFGHDPDELSGRLFDFQECITRWAIRRGRAAIFADCGFGKTLMQLEWARHSGPRVLIAAPLAVAEQTIAEGKTIGLDIEKVDRPQDRDGIQITNYEKMHHFIGAPYDAIVLDESGILKSLDGKTRTMLIKEFSGIQRRLCCTATPAPNDLSELANHAEFLGVMSRVEMLATFFVHDSDKSGDGGWRIKGHAVDEFWRWVAKWAVYIRRPSDLVFDDAGFVLPPLSIEQATVQTDWKPEGMLFAAGLGGIGDRRKARKATIDDRIAKCLEIINGSNEQWLVWCELNDEGNGMEKALGNESVQIAGIDSDEEKIEKEKLWRSGGVKTLITKPSIFGFGMNWQHCHNVLFLGIGDSYEKYYQSMRRCWRFGQKHPVRVVIVASNAEQEVASNVRAKEEEAARLAAGIVAHSKDAMTAELTGREGQKVEYVPTKTMKIPSWIRGD